MDDYKRFSNKNSMKGIYLFASLFTVLLSGYTLAENKAAPSIALAPVQQMLVQHFSHKTLKFKKLRFDAYSALKPLYDKRNYQPIWSGAYGLNPLGQQVLDILLDASKVGLSTYDDHIELIQKRLDAKPFAPAAHADLEIIMTDAFLRYVEARRNGQLHPRKLGKNWRMHVNKPWNAHALVSELLSHNVELKTRLQNIAPPYPGYRQLERALSYYLLYQSLKE